MKVIKLELGFDLPTDLQGKIDERLDAEDIHQEDPYNTYNTVDVDTI